MEETVRHVFCKYQHGRHPSQEEEVITPEIEICIYYKYWATISRRTNSMLNTSLWLTMHINGLVKLTHCQKIYTVGNAFRVENEFFHKETSKTLLIDFSVVSTKLVLPMLCMNKIRF